MRSPAAIFVRHYGAHPLHLLTMVAGFAMLGYILVVLKPATLWNPGGWWQSVAVWFAAALIGHDLVLFPIYALADAILSRLARHPGQRSKVLARNYIRIPCLAAGLTLLMFLPGIIEQGSTTYQAATGQTQAPFLGRWLLLTAAMFFLSALAYVFRRLHHARRANVSMQFEA